MGVVTRPLDTPSRQTAASRIKVHLRLLRIRGATYRVVTLRPGTRVAFSTNFFHQTWHIVTDERGARLLARLFWGLAFQRQPGTLVLVHGDYLVPTPFEAERSDPFLIIPTGLTGNDAAGLRRLKSRLAHLGPPTTTIRFRTFGLDIAQAEEQAGRGKLRRSENRHL